MQWITCTIWAVCCSPAAFFVLKFFSTYNYSLSVSLCREGGHSDTYRYSYSTGRNGPSDSHTKSESQEVVRKRLTHAQTPSKDVWEFCIMVDLTNLCICIDTVEDGYFSCLCIGRFPRGKKKIRTVSKQGRIKRAATAGTTAISIVLRWHVYCKGVKDKWPQHQVTSSYWTTYWGNQITCYSPRDWGKWWCWWGSEWWRWSSHLTEAMTSEAEALDNDNKFTHG